ncbi:MAG: hypothetical protein ACRD63_15070, partial [Pyrinomonadaceae bacterium]
MSRLDSPGMTKASALPNESASMSQEPTSGVEEVGYTIKLFLRTLYSPKSAFQVILKRNDWGSPFILLYPLFLAFGIVDLGFALYKIFGEQSQYTAFKQRGMLSISVLLLVIAALLPLALFIRTALSAFLLRMIASI